MLLLKYWRHGVVILAILAIFAYWYGRTATIKSQGETIIQLELDKAQIKAHYEGEVLKLTTTIDEQNKRVEQLKQQGEQSERALNVAVEKAKEVKKVYQQEIGKILEAKAPETCEQAIQYLIDSKEDLKWKD